MTGVCANQRQTLVLWIAVFDTVELTSLIEFQIKYSNALGTQLIHSISSPLSLFAFLHRVKRTTEKMKLASRKNDAMANDARPMNIAARIVFALTSMAVCTKSLLLLFGATWLHEATQIYRSRHTLLFSELTFVCLPLFLLSFNVGLRYVKICIGAG